MLSFSDSHRQLLKAMLAYELQNYVEIKLVTVPGQSSDYVKLTEIRNYLEERIKELS